MFFLIIAKKSGKRNIILCSKGYFDNHREDWRSSILILQDIFCGVVPMGAENRTWRQRTGRLARYLSKEAQQVSRIFCGLEQRLK